MIFLIGATIFATVVTIALWISTLRPVDRITLFFRVASKTGLQRLLLRRQELCRTRLSNGAEVLTPGTLMAYSLEEVLKFKMRDDDVIVATYAKAGTTWMQEIVWLICNEANVECATTTHLGGRYGFLEAADIPSAGKGLQSLENWSKGKRRYIKTHLPFELLPNELQKKPKGKMIYVMRNPKDNCVSFFHFHRMTATLPNPGTWSEFLTKFCRGEIIFGSWFDHVNKYWQIFQDRKDSMYFVSFESLKKDLKGEVTKLAEFLEKDLSEKQIDAIVDYCTFSNMSKSKTSNYSELDKSGLMDFKISKFMRKGEVGDWKNHFTLNQNKAFDEMFKERTKDWTLQSEFEIAT